MKFHALVEVSLRPGIADPEGTTIERNLPALSISGVSEVRAGRAFRFSVEAPDEAAALAIVGEVASRLLSNPVIEDHRIQLETD
ncbi:MAG: phosphoribosylformylglycinamidine synthase subunit PurS [Actinobacteria bacterium]|nr:phosphoribosylformylglycinamidine synthase subunit PurS [Actinomycetota bacterium]